MTAAEFSSIRERAGLSPSLLATMLRSDVRTVRRWEAGERRIPGPVSLLMEMVADRRLSPF